MSIGLGPVARVVDYDPRWLELYAEERTRVIGAIGPWLAGIEHIGSTAVPGLAAKPIIDILAGLRTLDDARPCIPRLEAIGYEYVPEYEKELPGTKVLPEGSAGESDPPPPHGRDGELLLGDAHFVPRLPEDPSARGEAVRGPEARPRGKVRERPRGVHEIEGGVHRVDPAKCVRIGRLRRVAGATY